MRDTVFFVVYQNNSTFDLVVTFRFILMQTQMEVISLDTSNTTPQTPSTITTSNHTWKERT